MEKERSRGSTALLLSSELSGHTRGLEGMRMTGRRVNAVGHAAFRGPPFIVKACPARGPMRDAVESYTFPSSLHCAQVGRIISNRSAVEQYPRAAYIAPKRSSFGASSMPWTASSTRSSETKAVMISPNMTAWLELNDRALNSRHSNATGLLPIRG